MASRSNESIRNHDLLALKAFVTAQDSERYDALPSDLVLLDLTHSNLQQQHIEVRFFLSDSVDTLRQRIYQKTGTPPSFQHLQIYSGAGVMVAEVPPENRKKLGYFGLRHGMRVHCIDTNPHSGSRGGRYEDTSLVTKYVMSDEAYNQRKGTLRDWERQEKEKDPSFSLHKHGKEQSELAKAKRQAKLGLPLPRGFQQNANGQIERIVVEQEDFGPETVEKMSVGMRCEVQPGGRRGLVAHVGEVPELGGYWVGIVFDEPVGKTDGTTPRGKRYFDAPGPKHGGFVRGKNVAVGDFPERDIFDEDSEDEL